MQQILLGGDGTTGETGATHNTKANANFTELYAATAAAQADADAAQTAISDHISDGTAAHAASAIAFTGVGTISATNVQDAIAEVAAEAGSVSIPDASETVKGIIEIATVGETTTGTDATRAVTPAGVKAVADQFIAVARTGTSIAFATNNIYGTPTSPITGNLTANQTGAVLGAVSLVIHNSGTAPTLDSNFKLTSGVYITGKVNIIQCTYLEANYIAYSIITVI